MAALAWLLVAGAVFVGCRGVTRPDWPLAIMAAVQGLALFALPVMLPGVSTRRYAAVPAMLTVTALVSTLQPAEAEASANRYRAAPLAALAVLLGIVGIVNLRADGPRAHGPGWSDELQRARVACADIAATAQIPIPPVRPSTEGPPWLAALPCTYVQR